MGLRVVSIETDGSIRLAADGPITSESFRDSANPLPKVLGANWAGHRILLDLASAEVIDSSFVGWLVSVQKELTDQGGLIVLHSLNERAGQILRTLKIELLVPIMTDEAEAREAAVRHPRLSRVAA